MSIADPLDQLLWLSHQIGREDRGLALGGEGSVSARLDATHFGIRASATTLHEARSETICRCKIKEIIGFIDSQGADSIELQAALARTVGVDQPRPTTEALFHAWLLHNEGINFVAHCHPEACLQVLCSPAAERFAEYRMFPDEVLATGAQSSLVPYQEPGAPLAREIRAKVNLHIRRSINRPPRLILLQNHGIIAVGPTPEAVLTTVLMAEKAARVYVGSARLGGPIFMTQPMVMRIDSPARTRR